MVTAGICASWQVCAATCTTSMQENVDPSVQALSPMRYPRRSSSARFSTQESMPTRFLTFRRALRCSEGHNRARDFAKSMVAIQPRVGQGGGEITLPVYERWPTSHPLESNIADSISYCVITPLPSWKLQTCHKRICNEINSEYCKTVNPQLLKIASRSVNTVQENCRFRLLRLFVSTHRKPSHKISARSSDPQTPSNEASKQVKSREQHENVILSQVSRLSRNH